MHALESALVGALECGQEPIIGLFGGWDPLVAAASEIGSSPLMPEFLKLAIAASGSPSDLDRLSAVEFICLTIEAASNDIVLVEAVDLLSYDAHIQLGEGAERCFARFLSIAANTGVMPMARAAALDGAFRWSFSKHSWRLRLLAFLLETNKSDDPIFLSHVAKIAGVAYSHWREQVLVPQLQSFTGVPGVADEASFELGMAKLNDGLAAEENAKALESFSAARHWFGISVQHREQRPDAASYCLCLDILAGFSSKENPVRLSEIAGSISDAVFQMEAWHASDCDPSWLGRRHIEITCWSLLALNLRTLSSELEEVSWWEPAVVVKQHILASYVASRSILQRSEMGGIETIVRPRIENALAQHDGQAYALKSWLRHNKGHDLETIAQALSDRVAAQIAANARSPIAALIDEAEVPNEAKTELWNAIQDSLTLRLKGISQSEEAVFVNAVQPVIDHPDYANNRNGKTLFRVVLLSTLTFLSDRLNMTRRYAPEIGYLFESRDGSLPKEDKLHADYRQFMKSVCGNNIDIEVSNIGGGRSDVRFKHEREQLVVEVKRDSGDCSFDGLATSYASQTSEYQNTGIRLGILLVLDQSEIRKCGTPHISTLVQSRLVACKGETPPRGIVIIKVPGRRFVPSDLT